MLHIICPNTSIDVRIQLDRFVLGEVQRAMHSAGFASGKGVNSAFTCDFLGVSAHLHAMVGSLDRDYFGACDLSGVDVSMHSIPGETRRNLTIIDNGGLVAHIQTEGYIVEAACGKEFIGNVVNSIKPRDVALISGSLPEGFGHAMFLELLAGISHRGALIVLDTDLQRIGEDLDFEVEFVKPNIEELRDFLSSYKLGSISDGLKLLGLNGVKFTIVTCGADGAYIFENLGELTLRASSSFVGEGGEAIGSGDAFIGAFAAAISMSEGIWTAFRRGMAAGHSNIFHKGPGRIGPDFYDIEKAIDVRSVDRGLGLNIVQKLVDSALQR